MEIRRKWTEKNTNGSNGKWSVVYKIKPCLKLVFTKFQQIMSISCKYVVSRIRKKMKETYRVNEKAMYHWKKLILISMKPEIKFQFFWQKSHKGISNFLWATHQGAISKQ